MIKRLIEIPTNNSKIYQQILAIMNFIIDATSQEREVLSELIKLNNDYDALEKEKRAKFILSTEMRREMRNNMGIQEKQFNSLLSRLKKKKLFGKPFIDSKGVLHPELMFKPDEEGYEITVRINKDSTSQKERKATEENEKFTDSNSIDDGTTKKEPEATVSKETKQAKLANDSEVIENPHEGNITLM